MERLDREVGAGGRRRARRKDEQSGQRAQRGKRPEEARAERKDARDPSRRSVEAQSRQQQTSRGNRTTAPAAQTQGSSLPADSSEPFSFQAHLTSKSPAQKAAPLAEAATAKPEAKTESSTPIAGAYQLQVQKPEAAQPAALIARAAGSPSVGAAPRAQVSGTEIALVATATNNKSSKSIAGPQIADPGAAVLEQAEAQEAQRSAQVLRQVRMQLHPGMRTVSIQLAPADLGRLSIRMRVENGEVQATVRAESEEALAALERHIPELEAAFEDQGFEQMSFEFVLDQQGSPDAEEWRNARDVSGQLETLIENKIDPALRGPQTLSDIEVDTYA